MRLGVVTGMKSEAAALTKRGRFALPPVCAAGRVDAAERLSHEMLENGAEILLSVGLAGGLAPGLRPGECLVATSVASPGETHHSNMSADVERRFADALRGARISQRRGALYGSMSAILTADAKSSLHLQFNAQAADMESLGIARAACTAKRPFIVLRVIADPADRAIPAFALTALRDDGGVRLAPIMGGILADPTALAGLIALASASRAAHRTLVRIAPILSAIDAAPD